MKQPVGVIKFYDSLDETFDKGFYCCYNANIYPILVDKTRLAPFQIKRTTNEAEITIFKLINIDTGAEIDIDTTLITVYKFKAGFEQLIYSAQQDLTEIIVNGLYNIKISDSTNDWYSNPIKIGEFNTAIYGFGAFSDGFDNGFEIEGALLGQEASNYVINLFNAFDFEDKIWQFGFQDLLLLDENNSVEYYFDNKNETQNIDNTTGKENTENIYHFKKYKISFIHNKDIAEMMSYSEMMDKLTIIDTFGTEIQPIQWQVDIQNIDSEIYHKITLSFDNYYINKNNCNNDY